jgi:hypothetical protein
MDGSLRIAVNPSSTVRQGLSWSSSAFLEVFRVSHGKARSDTRRTSPNLELFYHHHVEEPTTLGRGGLGWDEPTVIVLVIGGVQRA